MQRGAGSSVVCTCFTEPSLLPPSLPAFNCRNFLFLLLSSSLPPFFFLFEPFLSCQQTRCSLPLGGPLLSPRLQPSPALLLVITSWRRDTCPAPPSASCAQHPMAPVLTCGGCNHRPVILLHQMPNEARKEQEIDLLCQPILFLKKRSRWLKVSHVSPPPALTPTPGLTAPLPHAGAQHLCIQSPWLIPSHPPSL